MSVLASDLLLIFRPTYFQVQNLRLISFLTIWKHQQTELFGDLMTLIRANTSSKGNPQPPFFYHMKVTWKKGTTSCTNRKGETKWELCFLTEPPLLNLRPSLKKVTITYQSRRVFLHLLPVPACGPHGHLWPSDLLLELADQLAQLHRIQGARLINVHLLKSGFLQYF